MRPITIDELLAHASWVRALAVRLTRDAATADDVVQKTWLAGLRRPPSDPTRVRGWLATVVRNFAREERRAQRARSVRELRVARREAVWETSDLVEHMEASRRLAEPVLALPEPYRTVLLRRYYQGVSAREIARQEGVPVETVRTRIKRGIWLLRQKLEERDGASWALGLVPLLPGLGGATGEPATRAEQGGALRGRRVAAVAALAVVIVAGAFVLRATTSDAALESDLGTAKRSGLSTRPGSAPQRASAARPVPAATAADPVLVVTQPSTAVEHPVEHTASATAHVRVTLRTENGEAALPIRIRAVPQGVGAARARAWTEVRELPGAQGDVELPLKSPVGSALARWELRVEHEELVPTSARVTIADPGGDGAASSCELPLVRAGVLAGTVSGLAPGTRPQVAVFTADAGRLELLDLTEAAATGEYRLRLWPDAAHHVVVATSGYRPLSHNVTVGPAGTHETVLFALDPGSTITGTLEGDGEDSAGAIATVWGTSDGVPWSLGPCSVAIGAESIDWAVVQTTTDAAGRFRVAGLAERPYRVSVAAPGMTPDLAERLSQTVTPPVADLRLHVDAGTLVVELRSGGVPLPGAGVAVSHGVALTLVTADAQGLATIRGVPDETCELEIVPAKGAAPGPPTPPRKFTMKAPPAGTRRYEILEALGNVPAATLTLTFTGTGCEILERAGLALLPEVEKDEVPARPLVLRDLTGTNGAFRVAGLPAGHWRVLVRPGAGWNDPRSFFVEEGADIELRVGEESVLALSLEPAGRLRLAARTAERGFVAARCLLRTSNGTAVHFTSAHHEAWGYGAFENLLSASGATDVFPAVRPGRYRLRCEAQDCEPAEVLCEVRAGEVTETTLQLSGR